VCGLSLHSIGIDGASQNPHPSDADFMCKFCQMRMQICCAIKISTSYYSTAIELSYLKLNSYKQTSSQ